MISITGMLFFLNGVTKLDRVQNETIRERGISGKGQEMRLAQ